MTHAALSPLIGPEFDDFLFAPIGEDRNGTTLSVLSALARLDVDPWQEATRLARMPREAAAARLTLLIDALPREPASAMLSQASGADLVALLPKAKTSTVGSPDSQFAATGLWDRQIVMALCAIAIIVLIVFAVLAFFPPRPGSGANRSGARRRRRHDGAVPQV